MFPATKDGVFAWHGDFGLHGPYSKAGWQHGLNLADTLTRGVPFPPLPTFCDCRKAGVCCFVVVVGCCWWLLLLLVVVGCCWLLLVVVVCLLY